MKDLVGFVFNVGALVAIDTSAYKPPPTLEGHHRIIVLHLVGPVEHVFEDEAADAAYVWYLHLTGQARIGQP
jgi:hypothetical protein